MKKYLSKILISLIMVAIFMAPVSGGIQINDKQHLAVKMEINEARAQEQESSYFDCQGWWPGSDAACKVIAAVYYVVFMPMAYLTSLAGQLLDFFVYYSTNSNSYNGAFVNKAWAAVRDVANIFFIIALLYVAIKTILGLNVTDNKKIISYVVIIALVINFSLFTTKVVIDSSNILAKIFYNNMTQVDKNGKVLEADSADITSVSVGLVKQFDPQVIVTGFKDSKGTFIFIMLLSILIMGFMIYIFLSVALLFVARVVSLWLAMIFSPIAFISYALPFKIPGFGHEDWWPDLIKNAFLAPIFIFFLYVITLFGDALKNIPLDIGNTSDTWQGYIDAAMKTIIPFAIIFILLLKAKHLAVKFSGDIGAMVSKIGAIAGGLAVGAATGGTALAARTVIGGGGGYLASQAAKGAEKFGFKRTAGVFKDIGKFAQKSSFDVRQTGLGKAVQKGTGLDFNKGVGLVGLGTESTKGGWSEMKKKQQEKRQKRADELENRETSEEKKKVDDAEIELKEATLPVKLQLEDADREIDKARKDLSDAAPSGKDAAAVILRAAKDAKEVIRTAAGLPALEKAVHVAKYELTKKGEGVTTAYAEKIKGDANKLMNQIFRLGAYSRAGADEAARKIRTGTKLDSGEKPH